MYLRNTLMFKIAEKVKNFAVIYLVDITEVPDFNKMYELYDPSTVMFFFRNKHIMVDLGAFCICERPSKFLRYYLSLQALATTTKSTGRLRIHRS